VMIFMPVTIMSRIILDVNKPVGRTPKKKGRLSGSVTFRVVTTPGGQAVTKRVV
jgi:hypothetical protein